MESLVKKQKIDTITAPCIAADDAFHLLLLPELRALIRSCLATQERFRLARSVCRKWKEEDKQFELPTHLQDQLLEYMPANSDPGRREARRRLLCEWITGGGLTWRLGYTVYLGWWNTKEEFTCRWYFPCDECHNQHALRVTGHQRVVSPSSNWPSIGYDASGCSISFGVSYSEDYMCSTEAAFWSFGFTDAWSYSGVRRCPRFKGLECYFDKEDKLSLTALLCEIPPELRDVIENRKPLRETLPLCDHLSSL